MKLIQELIKTRENMLNLIEDIAGAEIVKDGYYGSIMYVRDDGTARIYLEDEDGENWEEDVTLEELVKFK